MYVQHLFFCIIQLRMHAFGRKGKEVLITYRQTQKSCVFLKKTELVSTAGALNREI